MLFEWSLLQDHFCYQVVCFFISWASNVGKQGLPPSTRTHRESPSDVREKERERRRRRRWRLVEEKHEDYPRCLSEQAGRASRLPSRVRGRLEAEGGSGEEDRMEEKKQFLCGVVEGKSGRLHNWPPVRSCDSFFFFLTSEGMILNTPPLDLDFSIVLLYKWRWACEW